MKVAPALALLTALVAAPAAHAALKLRLGGEAVVGSHDKNTGWTSLTDQFRPSANVMLGWVTPLDILSIDLEVSEQWITNPPAGVESRQGTTLRPGVTLSAPIVPVYARFAIPLKVEPSPFQSYARLGAGLGFNFLVATVYVEADADFLLTSGETNNIQGVPIASTGAFQQQIFSAGAGLSFKF
jgi:hypothetical protein